MVDAVVSGEGGRTGEEREVVKTYKSILMKGFPKSVVIRKN